MTAQPIGIKPGMYFHLDNETYHDDPALSHSGMTRLLVSWPDFWTGSCFNPERKKQKVTDAMEFGKRSGMLLLEPKTFYQTFNTHGRAQTSAKGQWLASHEWARLTESVDAIMDTKAGRDYFSYGYPEVTIVYRDRATGIMVRARTDYLRTFGVIDFKRIAEMNNRTIGGAVKNQGLDIQAFLYLEAVKEARLWLRGLGTTGLTEFAIEQNVDPLWLAAFRDDNDLVFRFLFQRSAPPYIWEIRELDEDVYIAGGHAVFEALRRYQKGLQQFGLKKPPMGTDKVKSISAYHVPRRDYEYGED